jgi:hypothetical protein
MVPVDQALSASATGIFLCLRQLADEAAILNMPDTLMAIERALDAAARESEPQTMIH